MQYYPLLFAEGVLTFLSPCVLPLLPVYLSYMAGSKSESKISLAVRSVMFILGFTVVFTAMGAFFASLGGVFVEYKRLLQMVSGGFIIYLGITFTGLVKPLKIPSLKFLPSDNEGLLPSFMLGVIFAVGWTPCVGAYLASALLVASTSGGTITGALMLICYSLGLGIPFLLSALMLDSLKSTLDWLKRNNRLVSIVSGVLMIGLGIAMMGGFLI